MTSNEDTASKQPTPDPAETNAFFPSPYSLSQYVPPKTDFDGVEHPGAYTGPKKVLMIGTDDRYLLMRNDTMFSTGNHPVEMLLPLWHLHETGFEIDVATLEGNSVKLENWAMPAEDETVKKAFETFAPKLRQPKNLRDVIAGGLDDYAAVFIPGGHGAVLGLADSDEVKQVLDWALEADRFMISLCHGPAAFASAARGRSTSPFSGYEMCVFPDALDEGPNVEIGYLPGQMRWLVAQGLAEQGVTVVNDKMSGQVHQDRTVLTGDSPLASNALGKLAANALLDRLKA